MEDLGPLNPMEREIFAATFGAAFVIAMKEPNIPIKGVAAIDAQTHDDRCARGARFIAARAVAAFRRR